jgi:hypothetical protein
MPTKKRLRQMTKDAVRIPGGNELPKGSRRPQTKSQWDGVPSQKSIWDIAQSDFMRSSKGTAWAIKRKQ